MITSVVSANEKIRNYKLVWCEALRRFVAIYF